MDAPQTAAPGEKVSGCQPASCHWPLLQVSPSLLTARASTQERPQTNQTDGPSRSSMLLGWASRLERGWYLAGELVTSSKQTVISLAWHNGKEGICPQCNGYRYPWVLNNFNMRNFKDHEKIISV